MKFWKGKAYRSPTGFRHARGKTAADVVRYEQDELGNDYGITEKTLVEMEKYSANDLEWVTKTRDSAKRYGEPEEEYIPSGSRIIAEDGDGGYLVLKKRTKENSMRNNPREGKIRVHGNPFKARPNTGEPDQDYDHEFFDEIVRQLSRAGFKGATHREFDKYQGVYLHVPGVDKFWIMDVYSAGKKEGDPSARTFTYKKGTRTDFTVFQGEHSEDKVEVSQTESGKVDASELVEFCRGVIGGSRVGRPRRTARGNPLSGRHIGSQYRETLAQAGYRVHERLNSQEVILEEISSGDLELWTLKDDFAGWVVEIDGKGYEFVRGLKKQARENPNDFIGIGPKGKAVWQKWMRNMRGSSDSDLSDAHVWFMELYGAGRTGKSMPYSSSPQGADERAAYYAGRDDSGMRRFPPTRSNPDDEFAEYDAFDRDVLSEVKEAFDKFEFDLIATKKQDPGAFRKGFTVTYGYVPAWRSLLSSLLDDSTRHLSEKTLQSGILNEMFDETCDRLGEKGIIIWDDEGDGTVLWAGTEEAYKKYSGE